MILITKCPHCQTTFKVTEDQLKLYDGAVRCGVCQQIFNGTDHLQTEPPVLTDKSAVAEKKKTVPAPEKNHTAPNVTTPDKKTANPGNPVPSIPKARVSGKKSDDIAISLTDDDINASSQNAALFDALEEELSTISLELGQVTEQLFGNELEEISDEDDEQTVAASSEQHLATNETISNEAASPKPPVTAAATRFARLSLHPDPGIPAKNTVYSTAPRLDDVAGIAPSTAIEAEIEELGEYTSLLRHEKAQSLVSQYREPDPLMDKEDHHPAFFEMAEADDVHDDSLLHEPDFVRKGRKKKRLGFFSGTFLSIATLALLASLAVQCLYMFSDRITVWWPPSEPVVAKACDLFFCPRRLETRISSLSIESTELQVIPPLADKYSLSLLIRNSGSSYQSWPHIELTLIDKNKIPVARRFFAPANYLSDAERIIRGITPYSEEQVRLYLEMKTESEADYRISLFYP